MEFGGGGTVNHCPCAIWWPKVVVLGMHPLNDGGVKRKCMKGGKLSNYYHILRTRTYFCSFPTKRGYMLHGGGEEGCLHTSFEHLYGSSHGDYFMFDNERDLVPYIMRHNSHTYDVPYFHQGRRRKRKHPYPIRTC